MYCLVATIKEQRDKSWEGTSSVLRKNSKRGVGNNMR